MTASLPQEIQQVFDRFITTEYTTVDSRGQPICWPLTPYYEPGDPCIDVTTGLGYPKKANDARANPKVSLLFSDPTGSGMDAAPQVLVQGTADVDARDLEANRVRYTRESPEKLPGAKELLPPKPLQRCSAGTSPASTSTSGRSACTSGRAATHARAAAVRRPHGGGPLRPRRGARGRARRQPRAARGLGRAHGGARRALPERRALAGGPGRLPLLGARADLGRPGARRIRLGGDVLGVPVQPGLACFTVHDHAPDFSWQRNFQVRGDLVEEDGGWVARAAAAGRAASSCRRARRSEVPDQPEDHATARRSGLRGALRKKNETRTSRLRCALPAAEVSGAARRASQPRGFALCARVRVSAGQ